MIQEEWECTFLLKGIVAPQPIQTEHLFLESPSPPHSENNAITKGKIIVFSNTPLFKDEAMIKALAEIELFLGLNMPYSFGVSINGAHLKNKNQIDAIGQSRKLTLFEFEGFAHKNFGKTDHYPGDHRNVKKIWEKSSSELMMCIKYFRKGVNTNDSLDKFIHFWITLDMLCGWLTGKEYIADGLKEIFKIDLPPSHKRKKIAKDCSGILNYISSLTLMNQSGTRNFGKELQKAITQNSNEDEILIKAFSAMAKIRNELFHGNMSDRSVDAEQCCMLTYVLSSAIIRQLIENL